MICGMTIKAHERGRLFRNGEPVAVLTPGMHWSLDPLLKLSLQIVSRGTHDCCAPSCGPESSTRSTAAKASRKRSTWHSTEPRKSPGEAR